MFNIIHLIILAHPVIVGEVDQIFRPSDSFCLLRLDCIFEYKQIGGKLADMDEVIIQFAKSAAANLNSPPRIYATSNNSINLWPDQPGSIETVYWTQGIQLSSEDDFSGSVPITLTTVVEVDDSSRNYGVTFQATWNELNLVRRHSWKFHVNEAHQAIFTNEEGDDLPQMPM